MTPNRCRDKGINFQKQVMFLFLAITIKKRIFDQNKLNQLGRLKSSRQIKHKEEGYLNPCLAKVI